LEIARGSGSFAKRVEGGLGEASAAGFFSADYEDQRYERMDLAYEKSDWIETEAAKALMRNNGPLLAYIGGKESAVTSKDHNFVPGETLRSN
jgi:hypothetical protein